MPRKQSAKPSFVVRFGLLFAFAAFAALENNPIVSLQATLGLSPAPLERFFGIKSLFSGMTEGVHRVVRLDLRGSFDANLFAPLMLLLIFAVILAWRVPRIDSRRKELAFFAVFVACSILVNLFSK